MTPAPPGSLPNRLRVVAAYLRGGAAGFPGPAALSIETTARCNLRCPMCPRTGGGYPSADLPDGILYPLLEEYAAIGGDKVFLYGLGEPFLDRRIFEVLRRCRALGLGTVVSTNGTLLDDEKAGRLLEDPCDHLIVSIDAATPETYGWCREGGDYAEVVARTRALAARKHARDGRWVLEVQMVVMARNEHEAPAFDRAWRGVPGVDSVRLKAEEFGLPDVARYGVDGHLRRSPCRLLWQGPMLVRYTGDVYTCFQMVMHGQPAGNLRTTRLRDLWDGGEPRALRRLHAEGRSHESEACRLCPLTRPRGPFVVGSMLLRGTTAQRLVPVAERLAFRGILPFAEPRGTGSRPASAAPSPTPRARSRREAGAGVVPDPPTATDQG